MSEKEKSPDYSKLFTHDECQARYDSLLLEAKAMREAIAFYADVSTWNHSTKANIFPPISRDADDERSVPGNRAREALARFDAYLKSEGK